MGSNSPGCYTVYKESLITSALYLVRGFKFYPSNRSQSDSINKRASCCKSEAQTSIWNFSTSLSTGFSRFAWFYLSLAKRIPGQFLHNDHYLLTVTINFHHSQLSVKIKQVLLKGTNTQFNIPCAFDIFIYKLHILQLKHFITSGIRLRQTRGKRS